jgi:hypothetical protein
MPGKGGSGRQAGAGGVDVRWRRWRRQLVRGLTEIGDGQGKGDPRAWVEERKSKRTDDRCTHAPREELAPRSSRSACPNSVQAGELWLSPRAQDSDSGEGQKD